MICTLFLCFRVNDMFVFILLCGKGLWNRLALGSRVLMLAGIVCRFFRFGGFASLVREWPVPRLPLITLVLTFFCDLVADCFLSLCCDLLLVVFVLFLDFEIERCDL